MLWDEFLGAVLELAERGPSPPAIVSFPAKPAVGSFRKPRSWG